MRIVAVCGALLAATVNLSAPASAASYLITAQGTAFAFQGAQGTTPIAEVAALGGQTVFAAFQDDSSLANFMPTLSAGGQGTAGVWSGSVDRVGLPSAAMSHWVAAAMISAISS